MIRQQKGATLSPLTASTAATAGGAAASPLIPMNVADLDTIWRMMIIGFTLVAPAYILGWFLGHIPMHRHEQFQRDVIVNLECILRERCEEDG